MNTLLNLKEESSGWPGNCTTKEQHTAHISAYQTREGIALNRANIAKNDGQRSLAKLMLNSMWRKIGQCTDKIQVREFTDPQFLLEFIDSIPHHNITYVSVLTEDRVEIHYRQVADDRLPSVNLNIFVAAFTTCHARRRLYAATTWAISRPN